MIFRNVDNFGLEIIYRFEIRKISSHRDISYRKLYIRNYALINH